MSLSCWHGWKTDKTASKTMSLDGSLWLLHSPIATAGSKIWPGNSGWFHGEAWLGAFDQRQLNSFALKVSPEAAEWVWYIFFDLLWEFASLFQISCSYLETIDTYIRRYFCIYKCTQHQHRPLQPQCVSNLKVLIGIVKEELRWASPWLELWTRDVRPKSAGAQRRAHEGRSFAGSFVSLDSWCKLPKFGKMLQPPI